MLHYHDHTKPYKTWPHNENTVQRQEELTWENLLYCWTLVEDAVVQTEYRNRTGTAAKLYLLLWGDNATYGKKTSVIRALPVCATAHPRVAMPSNYWTLGTFFRRGD